MNDPYRRMIDRLTRCRRVLVTTHVRPDGDALGTSAALVLGMRKAGIEAEVLLLSRLPRKYAFVFRDNGIVSHDAEAGWPAGLRLEAFDALLVADTGTWSQLPGLKEKLAGFAGAKLVLDHHLTQEDWADEKLVVTQAAAAGEIAAELLDVWQIPIDRATAAAIFLAIASDTGWFEFSNTRPYTMRLAARLMEAGVDTDAMYQALYQNERAERVALQTRAQQSLQLLLGGRLAVMVVRREDFERTGADVGDTENLINVPLQIRTVQVSILLTEATATGPTATGPTGTGPQGPVRVSLRSKGQVDVARFAEQFGGGGHARASGLKLEGPLDAVRERVVGAMVQRMGPGEG